MARYYRRRYTRVVRPKKKWASNLKDLSGGQTDQSSLTGQVVVTLVENSASTSYLPPTPVILKAGNFKVQADVSYRTAAAGFVEARAYVVYVPEGIATTTYANFSTLIENHPEWVMAWKYASNDYSAGSTDSAIQTMQFSSRLKRNLNSGDRIVFVCLLKSTDGNITSYRTGGQAQYWTCAN